MSRGLEGAVVVVTGGVGGIGREYARALAEAGARVVLTDIDSAAAVDAAQALERSGHQVTGVGGDISSADDVAAIAAHTHETFGPATVLINNAAVFSRVGMSRVGFEEISEDEWDLMMNVNLKGVWLMCRAFVPQMREAGRGKIINISSGTVFKGTTTRIHYITTKAGILGFTRVLARELGADGINVNCLAPGSTLTESEEDASVLDGRDTAVSGRAIPRVQTPQDLIGSMLFLASSDSDFVTGQTLVVDGGSVMH